MGLGRGRSRGGTLGGTRELSRQKGKDKRQRRAKGGGRVGMKGKADYRRYRNQAMELVFFNL